MDNGDSKVCTNNRFARLTNDSTNFKEKSGTARSSFKVGEWVKVPTEKSLIGVEYIVGKVIARTPYIFVVRSEVGGFTVAYTWTEMGMRPFLFKSLTRDEAAVLVSERLKQRMW